MTTVEARLRDLGADVIPYSLDKVSAWSMVQWEWWRELRFENEYCAGLSQLLIAHADREVVVFAHSYGSYLLSKTFRRNHELRVARVVLYGSIVNRRYNWDEVAHCLGIRQAGASVPVLNCCGVQDIWPIYAGGMTSCYGPTGTRGFKNGRVKDLFFEGGHSKFLEANYAESTWARFAVTGKAPPAGNATPLNHSLHTALANIIGFTIWRPRLLWALAIVLAVIFLLSGRPACTDQTTLPLPVFLAKMDSKLSNKVEFRVFQENFSKSKCWRVRWRGRVESGSIDKDETPSFKIRPEASIVGLKHVDADSIMITCSLPSNVNWGDFDEGDLVVVEGDLIDLLPGKIWLTSCKAKRFTGSPIDNVVADAKDRKPPDAISTSDGRLELSLTSISTTTARDQSSRSSVYFRPGAFQESPDLICVQEHNPSIIVWDGLQYLITVIDIKGDPQGASRTADIVVHRRDD